MTGGPPVGGGLIAFEGIDGSGKSTQARLLADRLGALRTFEPGGTDLGSALRALLLDPGRPLVDGRAEALLMAADRAQHVAEVVRPALDAGRWVVTDRFSASTLAYQGFGRGLDGGELAALIAWATDGLHPDLTVLVDLPVAVASSRRLGSPEDRFEGEGADFQGRVAEGYRQMARQSSERWLVVDGSETVDEVADAVWSGVQAFIDGARPAEPWSGGGVGNGGR